MVGYLNLGSFWNFSRKFIVIDPFSRHVGHFYAKNASDLFIAPLAGGVNLARNIDVAFTKTSLLGIHTVVLVGYRRNDFASQKHSHKKRILAFHDTLSKPFLMLVVCLDFIQGIVERPTRGWWIVHHQVQDRMGPRGHLRFRKRWWSPWIAPKSCH